ncbi:low molecular weight phosphotyrosine protein phosphatase [Buchananella hordeovulneris]|uniref:low molecular weight protein-tyrosine-phosphatase n=1 Tax=Buchananella hordeovulneris TaxID=52770 RepID=UPI000F6024BF|nr:low molecular weight protein-tyrosine-phosphatase [Buchananella hordeovulneris]RRD52057.1 low molecular weight phosphotyrosine protein phosphatase [Buchananella hordeovulneris]
MSARVLMVCTGNICRSVMAELVVGEIAQRQGLAVQVTSAGVSAEESGNGVDHRAAATLRAADYPTGAAHRAHQVTAAELAEQDLVLAMTQQHAARLQAVARRAGIALVGAEEAAAARVAGQQPIELRMFTEFLPAWQEQDAAAVAAAARAGELDVADPWYGDMADFAETLTVIEEATPALLNYLRSQVIR